jgi:hypothetical protein
MAQAKINLFGGLRCLQCIGEYFMAIEEREASRAAGITTEVSEELPEISEAITLAPRWEQKQVGMNVVMGCVAVPVCMKHIGIRKLSPLAQAVAGGRLLTGEAAPNGT